MMTFFQEYKMEDSKEYFVKPPEYLLQTMNKLYCGKKLTWRERSYILGRQHANWLLRWAVEDGVLDVQDLLILLDTQFSGTRTRTILIICKIANYYLVRRAEDGYFNTRD